MNEVLISVIVSIYNVEKYLKRCLDSIINQTYKNLEIILVDDGSTDTSGMICDEYQKIDKRIKVYHKKNGGLSSARNYGINKAHGIYIGFVDSDDCINKKMYEILLDNMNKTNSDISIGSVFSFENDNELNRVYNDKCVTRYFDGNEKFRNLLEEKNFDSILVSNKLYKKKLFDKVLFPMGKIHEDAFIMHHLFDEANRIVYTTEYLFYYFIRDNSLSHSYNLKRLDEIDAVRDRLKFFKQKRFVDTNYYEMALRSYVGYLIKHYWYLNYYNKNNRYKKYIKNVKNEFDNNYKKIANCSNITFYNRIKYFIVRYFPIIYLLLKRIDIMLLRRNK